MNSAPQHALRSDVAGPVYGLVGDDPLAWPAPVSMRLSGAGSLHRRASLGPGIVPGRRDLLPRRALDHGPGTGWAVTLATCFVGIVDPRNVLGTVGRLDLTAPTSLR